MSGVDDGEVHVPKVLVPFLCLCNKKYFNSSVLFTRLLSLLCLWFLESSLLGSAPYKIMEDSDYNIDAEGGGDFCDDDSLVVVDVLNGAEGVGDGHVL